MSAVCFPQSGRQRKKAVMMPRVVLTPLKVNGEHVPSGKSLSWILSHRIKKNTYCKSWNTDCWPSWSKRYQCYWNSYSLPTESCKIYWKKFKIWFTSHHMLDCTSVPVINLCMKSHIFKLVDLLLHTRAGTWKLVLWTVFMSSAWLCCFAAELQHLSTSSWVKSFLGGFVMNRSHEAESGRGGCRLWNARLHPGQHQHQSSHQYADILSFPGTLTTAAAAAAAWGGPTSKRSFYSLFQFMFTVILYVPISSTGQMRNELNWYF